MLPILDILNNNEVKFNNLDNLLDEMLNTFIKKHTLSKKSHEEMIALSHQDEDIAEIFIINIKILIIMLWKKK